MTLNVWNYQGTSDIPNNIKGNLDVPYIFEVRFTDSGKRMKKNMKNIKN